MADDDSNNHGRASVSINGRSRGSSKAQLSLQKILQTISGNQIQSSATIDHHRTHQSSASSTSSEMMGPTTTINPDQNNVRMMGSSLINFDLNLSPPPEEEEEMEVETVTDDQSQTKNHQDSLESPVVNAANGGGSVQENDETFPMGPEDEEEEERNKRMRRWRALLEVVENVSGDDVRPEPMDPRELLLRGYSSNGIDMEGNASAAAEEEKAAEEVSAAGAGEATEEEAPAPAVGRRKSGRVQVLPKKYRDSIVEPLTSLSSRHNRSSSKHVTTAKRRSTR